jgi:MFS family permease
MTASIQRGLWTSLRPWVISFFAAMFFFYEFFQINMFDSINLSVMHAFHLDNFSLGLLSSIFFYSTIIFLLPAGQILDRFSARYTILITMGLCIVGIVVFALAHAFWVAALGRLLEGIGSAFCFLSGFKVASTWFDSRRLPLMSGWLVTIGMSGGYVAQTPMTLLVSHYGWRHALLVDATLGVVLLLIIFLMVRSNPAVVPSSQVSGLGYWRSMRTIYGNIHNWFCGLYTCLMNLPFAVLGAVWGSLYLQQAHHVSSDAASSVIGWLFLGTIIGSPVAGWLAERLNSKRIVMLIGTVVCLLLSLLVFKVNNLVSLSIIFAALGFFTSSQILGYPYAASFNRVELAAMSASVVSFTTMCGYLIFQPIFGWLIDMVEKNHPSAVAADPSCKFTYAMALIPAGFIVAGICLVLLKCANSPSRG